MKVQRFVVAAVALGVLALAFPAEAMQIFVQPTTGPAITLNVEPTDVIASLKVQVESQLSIPTSCKRLIFAGTQLEDNQTVACYNIQRETTLSPVNLCAAQIPTVSGWGMLVLGFGMAGFMAIALFRKPRTV